MKQRVPRYPPPHARLILREEGPPMYRALGYADRNNQYSDLCDPSTPGFYGPFAFERIRPNQTLNFGPGRFGLPSHPLAFTTTYWDDRIERCQRFCNNKPTNRIHYTRALEARPEAVIFPEMSVPGSGVQSRFIIDGYQRERGIPPPKSYSDSASAWNNLNLENAVLPF